MTGADAPSIAVAILAAGASTRLGRPKQLVPWRHSTLLHHAASTALDAALGPVLVLLGADADRCAVALQGLDVRVVKHEGWTEGMGSTIRLAAGTVAADSIDALLLMTCDQPDVPAVHLQQLAAEHRRSGAAVVATAYAGTVGIPALFHRSRFPSLAALTGDHGAKRILSAEGSAMRTISCPAAAFDVDTESEAIRAGDARPQQLSHDSATN